MDRGVMCTNSGDKKGGKPPQEHHGHTEKKNPPGRKETHHLLIRLQITDRGIIIVVRFHVGHLDLVCRASVCVCWSLFWWWDGASVGVGDLSGARGQPVIHSNGNTTRHSLLSHEQQQQQQHGATWCSWLWGYTPSRSSTHVPERVHFQANSNSEERQSMKTRHAPQCPSTRDSSTRLITKLVPLTRSEHLLFSFFFLLLFLLLGNKIFFFFFSFCSPW